MRTDNKEKMVRITSINQNYTSNSNPPTTVVFPVQERNYCVFNQDRVNYFVSQKDGEKQYMHLVFKNGLLCSVSSGWSIR